jgi:hypothetical protein
LHAFLCDDADMAPLVCFVCAPLAVLSVVRVERGADPAAWTAAPLLSCPAAAAAPLVATRRAGGAGAAAPRDLLVLAPGGAMTLHVGAARVCDCQLPPLPRWRERPLLGGSDSSSDDVAMDLEDALTPGRTVSSAPNAVAVGLTDACGAHVTVTLSDTTAVRCVA